MQAELEKLIDNHTLAQVVDTLSEICEKKANEHQDEIIADDWLECAEILDEASTGFPDVAGIK